MTSHGYRFTRKLVVATLAAALVTSLAGNAAAQTVTTPGGLFPSEVYQGTAGNGTTTFLGVRYAAAPTGALRFARPVAPAPVSGVVEATSFGSPCPQNASPFGTASTDEDCLFLNVYVPGSVSSHSRLPVMVFFHGGAFVDGEGSLYDPTNLVIQGNTIVVTVNYRLGILGYMADAALSAESQNGVSGNYGLSDQQFALQWARQNIAAFGGNPDNVTIFGESAGGLSVCANLVSPAASGLFHRAISESGPCAIPEPTLAGAEMQGAAIVGSLGCSETGDAMIVACLRSLPVSKILAVENTITSASSLSSLAAFFPNVDGVLIPLQPIEALALGEYNHVPVIEGTNHDEGRLFVALAFDLNPEAGPLTAAEYPAAVQSVAATLVTEAGGFLGGSNGSSTANPAEVQLLTNEILGEYPLSQFSFPGVALSAILGDALFSCTANIANEVFSLEVPAFGYELNDENAPMLFLPPVSFPYGATHTDELQFLFSFPGVTPRLNSSEATLAATMKAYWTNFAKNGSPDFFGVPIWAPFTIIADNLQSLTPPTPAIELDFAAAHKCDFWIGILGETTLAGVANALTAKGIVH